MPNIDEIHLLKCELLEFTLVYTYAGRASLFFSLVCNDKERPYGLQQCPDKGKTYKREEG